jgi:hypothetical protein
VKRSLRIGSALASSVAALLLLSVSGLAAPAVGTADLRTPNQAGFVASATAPITRFTGTLGVPTLTCPASGDVNITAFVYLTDPNTGESANFGWFASCSDGTAVYEFAAVGIDGGANASVTIAPGDTLRFSMRQNAVKGTVTASVQDLATDLSVSATAVIDPAFEDISATTSFCVCAGNVSPIPSFTPVVFGKLKFDGSPLGSFSPTKYEMYDGSVRQVKTSIISRRGTFSSIFEHA